MSSAVQKTQAFSLFYFKLGCLLFWAGWFLLACLTNFFDFLYVLQLLPADWIFRSGNYALLDKALHIYPVSLTFQNTLFICDIFVQGLSAVLFFVATFLFWQQDRAMWRWINFAFALSISLWGVFLLMEEIFIAYSYEAVHRGLFIFELMTLLAIHILPPQEDASF